MLAMDTGKQALVGRLMAVADRLVVHSRKAVMQGWADIDLTMQQLRARGFLAHAPRHRGDLAAFLGSSVSSTIGLEDCW